MADCLRGCATPHRCTNCLAGRAEHPPRLSAATRKGGRLCAPCERRLFKLLEDLRDELPELYVREALEVQHTGEREGSFRSRGSQGSPALIRLDVLAMISPESRPDETGLTHIASAIGSWVGELSGFRGDAGTLLDQWDKLVTWERVAECMDEVIVLHRHVMRALGETSDARPLGRCLSTWDIPGVKPGDEPKHVECGETVWAWPGDTNVRCRRCGRVYTYRDQIRLKAQTVGAAQ